MAITQKMIVFKIDVRSLDALNFYCRETHQMRNRVLNQLVKEFLLNKELLY